MRDRDKTKEQLVNELILLRQRITELETLETERKQAEEWESKYRYLFEDLNNAAFLADAENGRILEVNKEGEVLLGRTREEIIGMHQSKLHPPEKAKEYRQRFATHIEKGRAADYEGEVIRKDGSIVPVNISAAPFTVEGKRLIFGLFRDITEQKQAERTLRESERRYRLLAENVTDVISSTNVKTLRPTYMSPSVTRLLGYSVEEAMNRTLKESLTPASRTVAIEALREEMALEGNGQRDNFRSRTRELQLYRKDGSTIWAEVKVSFLRGSEGQPVEILSVLRDITERKKLEEKLRELYEQERNLRRKLEAEAKKKAEFHRALVHELKTPLTPVLASSELLMAKLQEEPLLSLASNINQGASRLNNRIDELLDLAKGEMGMLQLNLKPVDPLQLLHTVAYHFAPVASSRKQSLTLALHPLPLIQADEERLHQVVLNLLTNASKFTPEGGKITLRAEKKDTSLIVEVQDSGCGIAKKEQQRLFRPYYRVERDGGRLSGLGLGLALCKTLVELHGGQIWVESHVGKGSTFSFSVPLHAVS
jgi:PAS domain S-box-containing protein